MDMLIDNDQANTICHEFSETRQTDYSLLWNLLYYNRHVIFFQTLSAFIASVTSFISPVFLNKILLYVENPADVPFWVPFSYAMLIFTVDLLRSVCDGQTYFLGRRIGLRVRAILIHLIYEKSLARIARSDLAESSSDMNADSGKIVNLMSVDTTKILDVSCYFMYLWSTPLTATVCVIYLIQVAGLPGLAGLMVMILMIPLGGYLGKLIGRCQAALMKTTDERVSAINEVLQCIRIVKFFGWERRFEEKINQLRDNELENLWRYVLASSTSRVLWVVTPILVSFATFSSMTWLSGSKLTASTAFTSLAIFNALRSPIQIIPDIIVKVVEALVGLNRIDTYLKEPELSEYVNTDGTKIAKGFALSTQPESSFSWVVKSPTSSPSTRVFTLKNINISFPEGKLTVIHGPTGAGKSTLLAALLGELNCVQGGVKLIDGRSKKEQLPIAYASQQVWLQNASIRDNITFGAEFCPQRYRDTLEACALVKDLANFDAGDMTEIGEKGVNLSGGQKARISLARALYSYTPIILMDDPLSAVDAPTAKHLFEHAICGKLAQGRTRLLVTHAVALCSPEADLVVGMVRGNISETTLYDPCSPIKKRASEFKQQPIAIPESSTETVARKLVEDEKRFKGSVSFQVYWSYCKAAGGFWFLFFIFLVYGSAQLLVVMDDYFLKIWADAYKEAEKTHISPDLSYYMSIYAGLCGLTFAVFFIRVIIVSYGSIKASHRLHFKMIHRIMRSPVRFFEKTPMGRIMNRASKDMKDVDQDVAFFTGDFLGNVVRATSYLIVILVVTPTALAGIIPVTVAYLFVARRYLRSSREMKRIDSNTRSPIFSHFGETLAGAPIIRAYARQKPFLEELHKR